MWRSYTNQLSLPLPLCYYHTEDISWEAELKSFKIIVDNCQMLLYIHSLLLIVGVAVTVFVCMCLSVCEYVCMSVCQYACQYVCCLLVYVWSEYVWSMCVVCICMATTYYSHTYLPRSTYLTSSEPAHTTWLLLIKQNSLMTLTLSCACYTDTPIDLGLQNQTCNCELNLPTVVSLWWQFYVCVSLH